MLGLLGNRYIQVPLKKIKTEPVLCYPPYVQECGGDSWSKGVSVITESFGVKTEKISWELHAPTEIFSTMWKTLNFGSSRSVLIGKYQVKGCGATLSTEGLPSLMQTGTLGTAEAIHSYMISHLMNLSLPLGALKGLAVLKWDENHSLYIRSADGFRIAQVHGDISVQEKEVLWNQVVRFHNSSDTNNIFRRIMHHYATATFLGISLPQSADNILIDGRFLDEEELSWPSKIGVWRITLERKNLDEKMNLPFAEDLNKLCSRYQSAFALIDQSSPDTSVLITWFKESLLKMWQSIRPEKFEESQKIIDILFLGGNGANLLREGFSCERWPTIYEDSEHLIFRKYCPREQEIHRSNWAQRFAGLIYSGNSLEQSQLIHEFINKRKYAPADQNHFNDLKLQFKEGTFSLPSKIPTPF